jgi:hypothetical protein
MAKSYYYNDMQKTLPPNSKKSDFSLPLRHSAVLILTTLLFFSSTLRLGVRANEKCTTSDPTQAPGTVKNHTVCVDGKTQRWYLLFLPNNYTSSTPQPLIVSYHGGTRNASSQLSLDNFTSPAYNPGALVAYPQGIDVSLSSPHHSISGKTKSHTVRTHGKASLKSNPRMSTLLSNCSTI